MRMKTANLVILAIILVSFAIGIFLYPQMPDSMASHWNAQGVVDGYMPKFWGLFLMPLISVGMFLLFIAIPRIDPMKANIEKFRKYYEGFVVLVIAFLFYIYVLTLFWNLGFVFDLIQFFIPALAALFYYCGILVSKAKRNWFIGIRTPWTMSNERVWDRTHRRGGILFKVAGLLCLLGLAFRDYAIWFILVPVIAFIVYLFAYSYFEYEREIKK